MPYDLFCNATRYEPITRFLKQPPIMFGLDPLSRSVAIFEILLLLAFAAFVGWLIARLVLNGRIRAVRTAIADQDVALAECRQSKIKVTVPTTHTVYPPSPVQPVKEIPVLPVSVPEETDNVVVLAPLMTDAPITLAPERPFIEPILPTPELPTAAIPAMTGNSESAVLQRIAARATELNFDRIGLATAAEADDLKDIVGVGPFLERKLHSLGIYTFRQVSNFEKEDIDKVNEIIEFFPGRIERDDWVSQSKTFYERKYGTR